MIPQKIKLPLYAAAAALGVYYHQVVAEPLTTIGALVLTAAVIGFAWRPLSFCTRFAFPAAIATLLGLGLGMIPDFAHGGSIATLPPLIDPLDEQRHRLLVVPVLAASLAILLAVAAYWLAQALRTLAKPTIYPRATHPLVQAALIAQGQFDGYRSAEVGHVVAARRDVPAVAPAPASAPVVAVPQAVPMPIVEPVVAAVAIADGRAPIDVSADREIVVEKWCSLLESASIAYWLRHQYSSGAKRVVLVDALREAEAMKLLNFART